MSKDNYQTRKDNPWEAWDDISTNNAYLPEDRDYDELSVSTFTLSED